MDFVVKQASSDGVEGREWTIEDCENYVKTNRDASESRRKIPLHELLQGSRIEVRERKPVRDGCVHQG